MQDVALKVVKSSSPEQQERFLREIVTLGRCRSPHIVLLLGVCIQPQQTIMVMEYMSGGDLHSRLKKDSAGELAWCKRSASISLGIQFAITEVSNSVIILPVIHLQLW